MFHTIRDSVLFIHIFTGKGQVPGIQGESLFYGRGTCKLREEQLGESEQREDRTQTPSPRLHYTLCHFLSEKEQTFPVTPSTVAAQASW